MCMENETWYSLPKNIRQKVVVPLKGIISDEVYNKVDKDDKWYSLPKNLTFAYALLVDEFDRISNEPFDVQAKVFKWHNLPNQINHLCRLSTAILELYQNEPILKNIVGVDEGEIICIESTVTMTLKGENLTDVTGITVNGIDVATFSVIDDNTIEFNPIILAEYPQTNFTCELVATNSIGDSNTLTFAVKNDFEVDDITVDNQVETEIEVCIGDTFTVATNTALTQFIASNPSVLEISSLGGNVTVVGIGESYIYADVSFDSGSGNPVECGRRWLKVIASPAIEVTKEPTQETKLEGSDAQFKVVAQNVDSYQWQVSEDNEATWDNITNNATYSGATTNTLIVNNVTTALNNNVYKCLLTGISPCSNEESLSVVLYVNEEAGITLNPENFNAVDGQFVAFTVGIEGDVESIQWYEDTGLGGEPITNGGIYSGATSDQLFISSVNTLMNGNQYYAEITTANTTFVSNTAVLLIQ